MILFERLSFTILSRIENYILVMLFGFRREHSTNLGLLIFTVLKTLTGWIFLRFALIGVIRFDGSSDSCFGALFVTYASLLRVDATLGE